MKLSHEIKAYLTLKPHTQKKVSTIQQLSEDKDNLEILSAIQSSQNTILQMLSALTIWVYKLEAINIAAGSVGGNYKREVSCNQPVQLYSHDQKSKQKNHGDSS